MKYPFKNYWQGFWYSLPVQLLLMHFKKYQVLLVFWYILFASVNGSFMQRFGANILFLYPEYLDDVNVFSTALVGTAFGIFVMCWNITTFILHSKNFKFLAATTQPFLKFCINNAALPLVFLVFYFIKAAVFIRTQELMPYSEILLLSGGFLLGFGLTIAVSFLYFFGADKTIYGRLSVQSKAMLSQNKYGGLRRVRIRSFDKPRIDWYLSATFKLRQPRKVSHYSPEFLDRIFSQHHLAAVFSILFVFVSLIAVGFLQDNKFMQLPAAGSIMVLFALAIAAAGAFTLFLSSWALVALLLLIGLMNVLYKQGVIDPRNKAYGLNYKMKPAPNYAEISLLKKNTRALANTDSAAFITILENWKKKQQKARPTLILTAVSGGGSRAATFSINIMRMADSLTQSGYMHQNFMIAGASGGMIGAAWFRELYWRKHQQQLTDLYNKKYIDDISKDLLNPIFSSLVSRDLVAPAQHFNFKNGRYIKDRGYAFEEKLNRNTYGWLNKTMGDYAAAEYEARIPLLMLSAVVTRDGRRMFIANQNLRFMTKPHLNVQDGRNANPDAVDFKSFFEKQEPQNLRFLSALRMNATFPYILPNVWLPSSPVVDVMDAGFRDNTGLESVSRFLFVFRRWIQKNCDGVMLVQIRDKPEGGWQNPYQSSHIFDLLTKPALLTQNNLFRFQEFAQLSQWESLEKVYGPSLKRVVFEYTPAKSKKDPASLSFHLTRREKKDIEAAMQKPTNLLSMQQLVQQLNQ